MSKFTMLIMTIVVFGATNSRIAIAEPDTTTTCSNPDPRACHNDDLHKNTKFQKNIEQSNVVSQNDGGGAGGGLSPSDSSKQTKPQHLANSK